MCGEVNKWNFTFYNKVTVFSCDNQRSIRSKKMPEIIEAETLAEQFIALGLDKSIEVGNTMPLHTGLDPRAKCTLCNNRRKNKKINSYPIETEAKCFVISCRVHYT